MSPLEKKRVDAIRHIVHEYANFVSSAEMVLTGRDICGAAFKPPLNTHVGHAFYLNCRKLADFFQSGGRNDDIKACDYVPGFRAALPVSDTWRGPINKQLAHVTYARDDNPREIEPATCAALYDELKQVWRDFRGALAGTMYEGEFKDQVDKRKQPYADGRLSEFRSYDLG